MLKCMGIRWIVTICIPCCGIDDMDRYSVLNRVRCIEHTPVACAELEQIGKGTGQCLRLDLIEMFSKPVDFFDDMFGDCSIKARKIINCLRSKLNVIGQVRLSLFFTSSRDIRSEEFKDDWSRA